VQFILICYNNDKFNVILKTRSNDVNSPEKQNKTTTEKTPAKITIREEWCKGCGICVEFCPKNVLAQTGITGKATVTAPDQCIKCRLCVIRCPDFAIEVE
jgi:2-oxoglutarate ferredoxin oxidoreductase subunit delta